MDKSRCSHSISESAPWNTFNTFGLVNTSLRTWSSSRSDRVSIIKSFSRVDICRRHVKPCVEWKWNLLQRYVDDNLLETFCRSDALNQQLFHSLPPIPFPLVVSIVSHCPHTSMGCFQVVSALRESSDSIKSMELRIYWVPFRMDVDSLQYCHPHRILVKRPMVLSSSVCIWFSVRTVSYCCYLLAFWRKFVDVEYFWPQEVWK